MGEYRNLAKVLESLERFEEFGDCWAGDDFAKEIANYNLCSEFNGNFIGQFVEKAIAIYGDCNWHSVFGTHSYPRLRGTEFAGDLSYVLLKEFDAICVEIGFQRFKDYSWGSDALGGLAELVRRGCDLLNSESPVLNCGVSFHIKNEFGWSWCSAAEVDIIAGDSRRGYSFWEVKTGHNKSGAVRQVWNAWVASLLSGTVYEEGRVSRIGVLLPREDRKYWWSVDNLGWDQRNDIFECLGYNRQACEEKYREYYGYWF